MPQMMATITSAMLDELALALLAGAIPETDVQEVMLFDEDGGRLGSMRLSGKVVDCIELMMQIYDFSFQEGLLLLIYYSVNHINKQYTPPYVTAQRTVESRINWTEYLCMQGVAP